MNKEIKFNKDLFLNDLDLFEDEEIKRTKNSNEIRFSCIFKNCKAKIKSEYNLKLHFMKHLKDYVIDGKKKNHVYKCKMCDEIFTTLSNWNYHQTTAHKNEQFICKICKKGFSKECYLVAHERSFHLNYFPFKCPFDDCDREFPIEQNLSRHVKNIHKVSYRELKESKINNNKNDIIS